MVSHVVESKVEQQLEVPDTVIVALQEIQPLDPRRRRLVPVSAGHAELAVVVAAVAEFASPG